MSLLLEVYGLAAAQVLIAWAGTYLLHSSIAYGLGYALVRGGRVSRAAEERVWRVALFAAPVTTSAATLLSILRDRGHADPFPASAMVAQPLWTVVVLASWSVVVLGAGAAGFVGWWRIARWHRSPCDDTMVRRAVSRFASRLGIRTPRVSLSDRIPCPAAIGQGEICLPWPERVHGAQLEALLAHEVAHLARRDPEWRYGCDLTGLVCCFQPLNILVRRRLRFLAELAADACAAELSGGPLPLVAALGRLADTMPISNGTTPRFVSAAAGEPSTLMRRVQALVAPPLPQRGLGWSHAVLLAALLGPLPWVRAVSAAPQSAANRIEWVAPTRNEPSAKLLELRAAERKVNRLLDGLLP